MARADYLEISTFCPSLIWPVFQSTRSPSLSPSTTSTRRTSETTTTFDLIINWAKTGAKPTVADAQRICNSYLATSTAPHDDCRFDPNYTPRPWFSRVYPRNPDPSGKQEP